MFKTLLKKYMDEAGFPNARELSRQVSRHECKDSDQRLITLDHSAISRWREGGHVKQGDRFRQVLLCLCKILAIGSIEEINEFLKAAGHGTLTTPEEQHYFPNLPHSPLKKTIQPTDPPTSESKPSVAKQEDNPQEISLPIMPVPTPTEDAKEEIVITTKELSQIEQSAQKIIELARNHKAISALAVAVPILALGAGTLIYQPSQPEPASKIAIRISHPREGQRCPHHVTLSGTVTNLPADKELWIVKEPHQGSYHPDAGPTMVEGNEWRGTAYIGKAGIGADTGLEFPIHIVLTSHDTGKKFQAYLDKAHNTGAWIGETTLYDGEIMATLNVIRDDSYSCQLQL